MSRRIVSSSLQSGQASATVDLDSYFDRLVKYIPSDVVAAWLVASGIVRASKGSSSQPGLATLWVMFFVGLVFTFAWTWMQTKKPGAPRPVVQTVISTFAFGIWAYALAGPFPEWIPGLYRPVTASLILVGYTLLAARFVPQ